VLLGFAAAHAGFPIDYTLLKKVLKNISPPRVLEINTRALEEGFKAARNSQGSTAPGS
jgi:Pyruvate/2-oxoacid:ferredoxin oxidoreductase gamma subunit